MSLVYLDKKKASQFLVTGGAGFIGSNIVEHLLSNGFGVRILDNLSTGKLSNIEEYFNHPRFQFLEGDIEDIDLCIEACRGVTYILHHAALGSVTKSIVDPVKTNNINIKGTVNLLEAAQRNCVKRFVYASSSSVYGDNVDEEKVEERTGNPLSPYAISKKVNEQYAYYFHKQYSLYTVGLRYFNVYGNHQDPNSHYAAVIPCFINILLKGQTPIIYGDGEQTRDFIHVADVVQANLKACFCLDDISGQVFNIASGTKTTINYLYREISRVLGIDKIPEYKEGRLGDIKYSMANIDKASRMLGFVPSIKFIEGIKKTIEYYKEIPKR